MRLSSHLSISVNTEVLEIQRKVFIDFKMKIKSLLYLTMFIALLAKSSMSKYLLIEIDQGETSGMLFI